MQIKINHYCCFYKFQFCLLGKRVIWVGRREEWLGSPLSSFVELHPISIAVWEENRSLWSLLPLLMDGAEWCQVVLMVLGSPRSTREAARYALFLLFSHVEGLGALIRSYS